MSSRRTFLGQVAGGIGGLALRANELLRFGVIGYGARGEELARQAAACPDTEFAAVCDIYSGHREKAKSLAAGVKSYTDHRAMLEDRSLDAVFIATPQHLHGEHFVDSIQAGKHVYVESALAFTLDDAKRMRHVYEPVKKKQMVQVGHQACSSGHMQDAKAFLASGRVGHITALHSTMFRNTPHGKAPGTRPVHGAMNAQNIEWASFLGSAPAVPFDANRYLNWRHFMDYSGGSVFENMSQQAAFWYKTLNLQIPEAATATGGLYLWKDGRELPDTIFVGLNQPEGLLFTWAAGFGNAHPGTSENVLGTDGTISRGVQVRYLPEKVNAPGAAPMTGSTLSDAAAHMKNFMQAIRCGRETACPFEIGFRVSIACRMAMESYRQQRTVRWDSKKEEIV